ncbi:hypothetical protein Q3O60_07375 [Alkalimonas collagenimarina]|uniref:Uncharacterized protein n=1 Tax=Alkalimonas collagenimarina TaxID=400390 RepID=A0ABT9GYG5_9GAMM|nr:hypothetical protein [Alkalimonas collagenimarina]MDP4536003.1 hypothetical protein [Alkalimonas collagenimarina]
MNHQQQKIKLAVTSLFAFFLMLAMGIAASVLLTSGWHQHTNAIASESQLIIISSMHGYGPGIIVGSGAGALLFLLYFMYRCIYQTETQFFKKAEKILASFAVIGLVAIFVGRHFLTSHWQSNAYAAGFTPCPAMTLLSNRATMEVWVRNAALCFDADVRRIISRGTPDEMAQVERHLQARQKQQEARQKL